MKFLVKSTSGQGVDQTHTTIMAGVSAAIQYGRMAGHVTLTVMFEELGAMVLDADGATLFTIQSAEQRPVGRPATSVIATIGLEATPTCLVFMGRPSTTGWIRCGASCEMDVSVARAMVERSERPRYQTQYAIIAVSKFGAPLGFEWLPDVMAETRARVAAMTGRGNSLALLDVAQDIGRGFIQSPPTDATAWFLVNCSDGGFNPMSKRLVSTGGYQPFRLSSVQNGVVTSPLGYSGGETVAAKGTTVNPDYLAAWADSLPDDQAAGLLPESMPATEPQNNSKPKRGRKATAV